MVKCVVRKPKLAAVLSPVTIKKQADSLIVIAEKDAFRQFLIKNDSYNQNSTGFFDCELRKSSTGAAAGKYEGQATQSMLHPTEIPLAAKVCWPICLNTPASHSEQAPHSAPASRSEQAPQFSPRTAPPEKNKNRPSRHIEGRLMCLGRESNPYGHCWPRDFKSRVSTYSTTKANRVQI